MRQTKKIGLALLVAFVFSSCNKKAELLHENPQTVTSMAKSMATGASFSCANCQNGNQALSGTVAQQLASTYALTLKFDRAAPDYPTSVEDVWANTDPNSIVCDGQLVLLNRDPSLSKSFPTYYQVQQHPNNADVVFIDYWWTYKSQPNCFSNLGGHDYDWEHVVVQVNRQTNKVLTVTYFQHSGWYTIDWRNKTAGTVIDSFVGKKAHGNYSFSNSVSLPGYECSYWGDYRNPNGAQDFVQTANNLVPITCDNPHFSFNGNWGTIGKGPLYRNRNYWDFGACHGTDGAFGSADGCSRCQFGQQTQLGNIN